jgi:hypothetical protein
MSAADITTSCSIHAEMMRATESSSTMSRYGWLVAAFLCKAKYWSKNFIKMKSNYSVRKKSARWRKISGFLYTLQILQI